MVGRLLARQPRNRYRTAQALLDDLDRVEAKLGGAAPEPVPPGADSAFAPKPPEAAMSPASTRRVIALTAAITAAALLLVARSSSWASFSSSSDRPARPPPAAPVGDRGASAAAESRRRPGGSRGGEGLQRNDDPGENAGERGEIRRGDPPS